MRDDYGYNDNSKKPRKSGKFMSLMVRYNKILWVLLIAVAIYSGRGTLSNTINTFRNWEEIQAAKGDVILVQHLFIRDRFYQEDPENYSEAVILDGGTYYHNLREGSDITLEQEKFEFKNGDVYRHITIPYVQSIDIMDVETLKMFTGFKYKNGSAYYYDTAKQEWAKIGMLRGGTALPENTLVYLIFDDAHYVLFDQLYAFDEADDGVYFANSERVPVAHTVQQGGGWYIIQPFHMIEGSSYQGWYLTSSEPLVDLESSDPLAGLDVSEQELILRDLGQGNGLHILSDGLYSPVPEGYTPNGEAYFYRNDNAEQLDLLLAAEDSASAQELAQVIAFKIAQNVNEYGYFEMPVQNTKLYEDYGIRYGYADLKANAEIGQKLVTAAERFGKGGFEDAIRALAGFYAARLEEGTLPEYWHSKGEIKTVPASADTRKAVALFLNAAGELLNDSSISALADSI